MKAKRSFCIILAACAASSAFAQGAADNPKVFDDGLWRRTPWEGSFVPDDFIWVKPHAAYVGSNRLEIVWLTKERGSGWVDWTQDNWATTNRAWTVREGFRDFNELIHKIDVEGFDPSKPVVWRAVSMKMIEVSTCYNRYEGEPEHIWHDLRFWGELARKRSRYESGAVVHMEERVTNPLIPKKGKATIVVFNDIHHEHAIYTNLIQYAGKDVGLAAFNGDIIDHSRSEDDIIKFVNAPMAYIGRELHCATRYLRGNHEFNQAFAAHLTDYMALQDGKLYGAVDFGPARVVFLDTVGWGAKDEWAGGWVDVRPYVAEEAEWLAREVASDEWRRAKYRVVIGHVPPAWKEYSKGVVKKVDWPGAPLFDILKGKGVTVMLGAHHHDQTWIRPNEFADYDIFVGGAHYFRNSTLTRCEMDDESLHVRVVNYRGVTIHDWTFPERPSRTTIPVPRAANTNHYWYGCHRYRINQMKTAPRAPDFVLLGDSIFHYWDDPKNQTSWKTNFSGEGSAPYYGINLAIEGDTTQSLLWRLQNGLLLTNDAPAAAATEGGETVKPSNGQTVKPEAGGPGSVPVTPAPKVAFVLIGTNNTSAKDPPDDTVEGVMAVVEQVRAATQGQTKIVVYGLLPRGKGAADPGTVSNRYVNRELRWLSHTRNFHYRDIWDKFLNKDGTVNTNLLYDALHSGPQGFEVFTEDMLKALKLLRIPPAQPAVCAADSK